MHDAESDEARAGVLLQLPDIVLVRHMAVFANACRQNGFLSKRSPPLCVAGT